MTRRERFNAYARWTGKEIVKEIAHTLALKLAFTLLAALGVNWLFHALRVAEPHGPMMVVAAGVCLTAGTVVAVRRLKQTIPGKLFRGQMLWLSEPERIWEFEIPEAVQVERLVMAAKGRAKGR